MTQPPGPYDAYGNPQDHVPGRDDATFGAADSVYATCRTAAVGNAQTSATLASGSPGRAATARGAPCRTVSCTSSVPGDEDHWTWRETPWDDRLPDTRKKARTSPWTRTNEW